MLKTASEIIDRIKQIRAAKTADLFGMRIKTLISNLSLHEALKTDVLGPSYAQRYYSPHAEDRDEVNAEWQSLSFSLNPNVIRDRIQRHIAEVAAPAIVNHQQLSIVRSCHYLQELIWVLEDTMALSWFDDPELVEPFAARLMLFLQDRFFPDTDIPLLRSDVFIALVKGEVCPWCKTGKMTGCLPTKKFKHEPLPTAHEDVEC